MLQTRGDAPAAGALLGGLHASRLIAQGHPFPAGQTDLEAGVWFCFGRRPCAPEYRTPPRPLVKRFLQKVGLDQEFGAGNKKPARRPVPFG